MAVVAGVTAWVWFVWLPAYRPNLREGERYGIDVSRHQGRIDWGRVARDDISFAYIKATEGATFVDSRFAENWSNAEAAGLVRGAYPFFTLCADGEAQARNFLRVVPDDPDALPPAVDLELAGNCPARPDPATVERELNAFLTLVERVTARTAISMSVTISKGATRCARPSADRSGRGASYAGPAWRDGSSGR